MAAALGFYASSVNTIPMPHKQLDDEEWYCQYCHDFKDLDYDKVVLHEVTVHHAGCPAKKPSKSNP